VVATNWQRAAACSLLLGPVLPAQAPKGLALVVAIADYRDSGADVAPLLGCVHDARRVQRLLIDRFGFAADDVLMLLDERATHAAVVRAFHEHLIARAGPETAVVFWFSGHGSRSKDASGRETSKGAEVDTGAYDNSLIAYDSRQQGRKGNYDVTDDELFSLLRAVAAKTPQVLVVTDCCHSAGATRGNGSQGRQAATGEQELDQSMLTTFWPADVPFHDDDDDVRAEQPNWVHIAACAEDQQAGELKVGGVHYGTLTWFLTSAMAELPRGTSWRMLGEQVRARVAGQGNRAYQTVTWEGRIDREVFGGNYVAPAPGFGVDREGAELFVAAGRVHGFGDAAEFAIVGLDGRDYGTAIAAQMRGTWCMLPAPAAVLAAAPGTALRAMPRGQIGGRAPLRIRLGECVDASLLANCPWAEAAPAGDYALVRQDGRLLLQDAAGQRIRPVPVDPAKAQLELFREYGFRSLWEAVALRSALPLRLTASPADAATTALGSKKLLPLAEVLPAKEGTPRAQVKAPALTATDGGGLLTLTVTNAHAEALYVAVLSLQENREVNVIWPRPGETDNLLRPGAARSIPLLVGPTSDWQRERPMLDRYVAIATYEHADFTPFTSAAPEWQPTRGKEPAWPPFLLSAMSGTAKRGGGERAVSWGVAWFELELLPVR